MKREFLQMKLQKNAWKISESAEDCQSKTRPEMYVFKEIKEQF